MATKVIVLCGGDSAEREVSIRSGMAVAAAIKANGYEVVQLDPANLPQDYEAILQEADVVFPVLHGKGGEDGSVQAWLETHNIPFVGADAESSRICFNKWLYKETLLSANLPTPNGELVDWSAFTNSSLIQAPFVLKPFDGGSSVDTFIIRDINKYDQETIREAFTRYPQMLLERLVDGKEITISILGNETLPVIEIVPPTDGEFDYANKYNGKTQELCPPQSVSAETQKQAQDLALQIHELLHIRDMSRTDMIVASDGSLWVLETNTIPGLTDQSLFPKAAANASHDMRELVKILIEGAIKRRTAAA